MSSDRHIHTESVKGLKWHVIKLIWPYLSAFKQRIALAMSCLLMAKLASVSLPFWLKHIIDDLNSQLNDSQISLVIAPIALVCAYGLFRLLNVLFNELRDTLFGRVTERTMRSVGVHTFQHLHNLDLDYHLNRKTGGLSRDIERGTSGIEFLMRFMVFNIVPTIFEVLLVAILLMINYGWIYACITLSAVAGYIAYSIITTEWRTRFMREVNVADSKSNTQAIDSLLNYETVKYFSNEQFEVERYDTELAHWEKAKRKNRLSLLTLNGGQALIIAIAMTITLILAAKDVAGGKMSIGDFVLINGFLMQLFIPLNFFGFVYREIKGSLANIEAMFSLLKQQPLIYDRSDAKELNSITGEIKFDQVSFQYQQDRPTLKDMSFHIKPGQKVAIVGESGSGKSTLVKLLFRFYDVDQGSISIDGHDIRELTQLSLRQKIGVVPQDTVLFNDTLYANIAYGNPHASSLAVNQAIDMAHLRRFIDDLPSGDQTLVGERGLKLSGGEKQRVSIARTILKQPPILAFDEATSSLDSQSEQAILKTIKAVAKNHTSLVIAHRLSTVVDADNILVIDKGRIVEQGQHQVLLKKNGIYARLWHLQQTHKPSDEDVT